MKVKIFALALLFASLSVYAQSTEVPTKVKDAFKKLYPNISDVKWDKENKSEYEAGFKQNNIPISVVFNANGDVLETETTIKTNQLPNGIEQYIQKNYGGYTISEAAKIVDNKGKTTYEAEIKKENVKKDIIFDTNGKPVVKKDSEKDEEDETDED